MSEKLREKVLAERARRELERREAAKSGSTRKPVPEGGSAADSLGQGVFFGLSDEIAGALGAAAGAFDPRLKDTSFFERYRGIRDSARGNQQAFAERNPGADFGLQVAGGLTTGGIGAAKAGVVKAAQAAPTMLGKVAPLAKTGAVQGGLYGFGASEAETPAGVVGDTIAGAGAGAALAPVLPMALQPVKSAASYVARVNKDRVYREAADYLQDKVGLRLTTGQKTGSDAIKVTETTLGGTPMGVAVDRAYRTNRKKVQGKLMELAGFSPKYAREGLITREALDDAGNALSKRYREKFRGVEIDINNNAFLGRLDAAEAENLRNLPVFQKRDVSDIVNELREMAAKTGAMDGEDYQLLRSRLGKLAKSNENAQPHLAGIYRSLKHALDDAFHDAIGDKAGRTALDQQYGRYKTLLNTFEKNGGVTASHGEIPFASLLGQVKKGSDREFENLLTSAQMVLGDKLPNSGTANRLLNFGALAGSGAALGGLDAGLLALGLPIGASQALSRGVTGSQLGPRLGVGTVPVLNPAIEDLLGKR